MPGHWKHGWIPLDEAAVKSHGRDEGAAGLLTSIVRPPVFPKFPDLDRNQVSQKYRDLVFAQDDPQAIRKNGSVEAYMGADYVGINGGLRGDPMNAATAKQVRDIDRAFKLDGLTLKEDLVVRRGSGIPPGVTYKAGAFAVEPGYTSTTIDPGTAEDFKNNEWGTALSARKDIWTFDILVPKGTRVLVPGNGLQSEGHAGPQHQVPDRLGGPRHPPHPDDGGA